MNAKLEKQILQERQPLLIIAADRARKHEIVFPLTEKLRAKQVDIQRLFGPEITKNSLDDLALSSLSLSLFGTGSKCFVISGLQDLKTDLIDAFLKFLRGALDSGHYVVACGEKKHRSDRLRKWFKKEGQCLELPVPDKSELIEYALSQLSAEGVVGSSRALAEEIVEMGQGDIDRIELMIRQLSIYLNGEHLTPQTLRALFTVHPSPNEFQLFDSASSKNFTTSARLLDELFDEGKNPYSLSALFQRSLLDVCEASSHSAATLAHDMQIPSWRATRLHKAARQFSKKDLWRVLLATLRSDERMKGKSLGPVFELRRLVEHTALRNQIKRGL